MIAPTMRDILRHPTVRWLAIRIALLPIVFIAVSAFSYFAVYEGHSQDPARLVGGQGASAARIEEIERRLGLDKPLYQRYPRWLANAATGDLGREFRTINQSAPGCAVVCL
jgi:ABC-type dipeptide/oligopeptide/nickel transport system permease component